MGTKRHSTSDTSNEPKRSAFRPDPVSDSPPEDTLKRTRTWGEGDVFESEGFVESDTDLPPPVAVTPAVPACPHPERAPDDGRATHVPRGSAGLSDIWGRDFENLTPNMTLKGPGKTPHAAQTPADTPKAPTPAPRIALDGYDLQGVLGEGGVGIVYQAIQKSIEREIAVKMIKPAVSRDDRERIKFISEAMVTGELDHPNIVPIHDLGTTRDGQPYYVMKLVRGRRWSETVRDTPLTENLRILLDVCDAVSFAHSRGVIHRDLKPDNVMLGEFGEVQLMDWGLGASVTPDGRAPLTASQVAGGTPAYMAPEMVTGEEFPVGFHSDVYLLGGILLEITTGKPPHPGTHVLEVLENAMNNIITPVEQGGVLIDIAMKAMAANPADRHASVREFKQAILDYQANAESIATCERASHDLYRAKERQDYELFAKALFGFRRALELWPENPDGRSGVTATQLQYARCALEKGDYDLAATTLDASCAEHAELANQIQHAQQRRAGARRWLKILRITALGLTAVVIVILTVSSIWISMARRQAVSAMNAAVAAHKSEAAQRRLAEAATARAQSEEARAVQALADLEKAVEAMVIAQTAEERARTRARAAELVAIETRDELAKTGMLMDNSWWVFDAETAARRQQDAAESSGLPTELTVTLPNDVALDFVIIPPGDFVMGSPPQEVNRAADEYLHRVHHSRPFYLARFELTEAQWNAVVGRPPLAAEDRETPDPLQPVTGISVEQILEQLFPALQAHAPKGLHFRLPTEAEWEYACRAGTPTAYHNGDDPNDLRAAGWLLFNSERRVQPVGRRQPNAFGLHDMHGNVGEICLDQYEPGFYLESPTDDPRCAGDGERLVVRGGSVLNTPEHCRSAYRSYIYRRNEYEFVGVRLALVPDGSSAKD
jgi:formylglycine-generating enzyme required for sulfatase activity